MGCGVMRGESSALGQLEMQPDASADLSARFDSTARANGQVVPVLVSLSAVLADMPEALASELKSMLGASSEIIKLSEGCLSPEMRCNNDCSLILDEGEAGGLKCEGR